MSTSMKYPIDPNLQNSAQVLNTMTQEWSFMVTQSEDPYNQIIRFGSVAPHRICELCMYSNYQDAQHMK